MTLEIIPYNNSFARRLKIGFYTKCMICREPVFHPKYAPTKSFSRTTHIDCARRYRMIKRRMN